MSRWSAGRRRHDQDLGEVGAERCHGPRARAPRPTARAPLGIADLLGRPTRGVAGPARGSPRRCGAQARVAPQVRGAPSAPSSRTTARRPRSRPRCPRCAARRRRGPSPGSCARRPRAGRAPAPPARARRRRTRTRTPSAGMLPPAGAQKSMGSIRSSLIASIIRSTAASMLARVVSRSATSRVSVPSFSASSNWPSSSSPNSPTCRHSQLGQRRSTVQLVARRLLPRHRVDEVARARGQMCSGRSSAGTGSRPPRPRRLQRALDGLGGLRRPRSRPARRSRRSRSPCPPGSEIFLVR